MEFRIADTFTASLGKLTAQEQKVAKTMAFDLQLDPPGPDFWLNLQQVYDLEADGRRLCRIWKAEKHFQHMFPFCAKMKRR